MFVSELGSRAPGTQLPLARAFGSGGLSKVRRKVLSFLLKTVANQ